MTQPGLRPTNSLCGTPSTRQTFPARRSLEVQRSGPLAGLMANVTAEEGYFPGRHQPACGGLQTATRFFHPRPERLGSKRGPAQGGTDGPMHRGHPGQQAPPIARQEVPPLLLDRRERLSIQEPFHQVDVQQPITQRKVGQIADRAPAASAEKTAPPQSVAPHLGTSSHSACRSRGDPDPGSHTADTSSPAAVGGCNRH